MSRSYRQPYCKVHVWQEVLGEKKEKRVAHRKTRRIEHEQDRKAAAGDDDAVSLAQKCQTRPIDGLGVTCSRGSDPSCYHHETGRKRSVSK